MSRFEKKRPQPLGDLIKYYIKVNRLSTKINSQIVFSAWDEVSGAGAWTVRKFYREGKLYITLSSSVIRSQLYFQKEALLEKINAKIFSNELFTEDDMNVGAVKELILK